MMNKGRGVQPKGEQNGCSKLTDEQVKEIREKYSQGGPTQQKLGEEYGVHFTVISSIILRKIWSHI